MKTYCVWSMGEIFTVEGEPSFDEECRLVFTNEYGVITAMFKEWAAIRLQDTE